jgi:predicted enzyme related to lactoylglutathione lyase
VTVVITRDTAWPEGTPCWVDLGVGDIPLAIGFYSGTFGWEVIQGGEETGGYAIAHLDGRTVAGIGPKMGPPDTPTVWTMYLATDDADATAAKIKGAGGHLLMEPGDVMDAGRMAIAADITGAAFGIWQARAHTGVGLANAPGALSWNEHFSRDWEGAKAFYAAVFGYEYGDMSSDGSYATLLLGGHEVGASRLPRQHPGGHSSRLVHVLRHRGHRQAGGRRDEKRGQRGAAGGRHPLRPARDRGRQPGRGLQPDLDPPGRRVTALGA